MCMHAKRPVPKSLAYGMHDPIVKKELALLSWSLYYFGDGGTNYSLLCVTPLAKSVPGLPCVPGRQEHAIDDRLPDETSSSGLYEAFCLLCCAAALSVVHRVLDAFP